MTNMVDDGLRGDKELCSETLRVESKLFYLDLKENTRGRYLKISEKGQNRERSTIIVPSAGILWFCELFNYFAGGRDEQGPTVSKELPIENKVFFFDVGENPRGRFLRVSESGAGQETIKTSLRGSANDDCGAGAVGWANFRDTLSRIYAAEANLSGEPPSVVSNRTGELPVGGTQRVVGPGPAPPALVSAENGSQILRVGQKRFFLDPGTNHRGQFIRITEAIGPDRNSIIVPCQAIPEFQEAVRLVFEGLKLSDSTTESRPGAAAAPVNSGAASQA